MIWTKTSAGDLWYEIYVMPLDEGAYAHEGGNE